MTPFNRLAVTKCITEYDDLVVTSGGGSARTVLDGRQGDRPSPRTVRAALAAGLLVFVLASCSKPAEDESVLATVGSHEIRAEDLRMEWNRRLKARRPIPDKAGLLEEVVLQEALLQRARQEGLLEDPEVRREISNLLIGKLRDRQLAGRLQALQVSDRELQEAYEQNLKDYSRPAKVRLSILYLATSRTVSETAREALRDRIEEGRRQTIESPPPGGRNPALNGFGAQAIQFSDDQASRYRGGDIGWLDEGSFAYRWPREVLEIGYDLERGQVSEVIETDQGFYVVKKTDFRAATTNSIDQVQQTLRRTLMAEKRRTVEEAFREESLAQVTIALHTNRLEALQLPPVEKAKGSKPPSEPPALPVLAEPALDR